MIEATYSDKNIIVDILSNSFDDNKSVNYIVKQDELRKQRIKRLMEYSFNVCNSFGRVVISENKNACALILFPDKKRTTLRSTLWDIKLITNCIGLNGVTEAMAREKKIKVLQAKELLYYLWFIGVSPEDQNKGIGGALPSEIIRDAEEENRTLCLTYKPLYKIREICNFFQVSRPTLYDWIKEGKLKPYKIKSRVYFLHQDIQRLLQH